MDTMELIYFILGFLFTVTGYGIVLLTKTKSSHTALLKEITQYRDLTYTYHDQLMVRSDKTKSDLKKISEEYNNVQKQMESDAYEGNTKLNGRITELAGLFNEQGNGNKKLFDVADRQLLNHDREIQMLRSNFQQFSKDKGTIDRY